MKCLPLAAGLLLLALPLGAQESIQGKWYRGDLYSEATLTVDEKLHFTIEATHTAHSGEVDGDLEKINDGLFFAKVFDDEGGQRAVFLFTVDEAGVEVVVYGDQVGAGFSVSYDGKYGPRPLTDDARRAEGLRGAFGTDYDLKKVQTLLGTDVDYFIECVASRSDLETAGTGLTVLEEGFMPGVAPDQNAIFGYSTNFLYILFTDCRNDPDVYQFYTDDPQGELPAPFLGWLKKNPTLKVVRHIAPAPTQGESS